MCNYMMYIHTIIILTGQLYNVHLSRPVSFCCSVSRAGILSTVVPYFDSSIEENSISNSLTYLFLLLPVMDSSF